MTVTDQIKILNRKIKQNESQYDLDTEAAKIPALSSNNLDKYELLTGEDLGLKPSTVEQAKFEYSPLRKVFDKGLSEEDKKEGILKGLKNIKDRNEELINTLSATNKALKKLPLDSMFNLIKEHHKKLNSLNNLKPRTKDNKVKRLEVLIYAGYIYNELYYIYKSKYNREKDRLSVENKRKLDYKQLNLDDHQTRLKKNKKNKKKKKQEKKQEEQKNKNKK